MLPFKIAAVPFCQAVVFRKDIQVEADHLILTMFMRVGMLVPIMLVFVFMGMLKFMLMRMIMAVLWVVNVKFVRVSASTGFAHND
jgi:hypothetical protein